MIIVNFIPWKIQEKNHDTQRIHFEIDTLITNANAINQNEIIFRKTQRDRKTKIKNVQIRYH